MKMTIAHEVNWHLADTLWFFVVDYSPGASAQIGGHPDASRPGLPEELEILDVTNGYGFSRMSRWQRMADRTKRATERSLIVKARSEYDERYDGPEE